MGVFFSNKNKNMNIVITGATSGIGLATARLFASKGHTLILLARRLEKLKEISALLQFTYKNNNIFFQCDVQNHQQVQNVFEKLKSANLGVDVLINNAGLSRGLEPIQDGILQNWEEMIDTNVKGLLYVSKEAIPLLKQANNPTIVNISSIAGRWVYPNGNVYCASKSAAKVLSEAMRIDLNQLGFRVVNIDPGLVETEFSEVRFHGDTERAKKVYEGYEPLTAENVAECIYFAVSAPSNVVIADMMILPKAQASATIVNKQQ